MKFEDLPVGVSFMVNGTTYRKENLLGKSRMVCNAVVDDGYLDPENSHEWKWVFFELNAIIPFPDKHGYEVLDLLGKEIGMEKVMDVRSSDPPSCDIEYLLADDEGGIRWVPAKILQKIGVNIPFLSADTREDWELNIVDQRPMILHVPVEIRSIDDDNQVDGFFEDDELVEV